MDSRIPPSIQRPFDPFAYLGVVVLLLRHCGIPCIFRGKGFLSCRSFLSVIEHFVDLLRFEFLMAVDNPPIRPLLPLARQHIYFFLTACSTPRAQ